MALTGKVRRKATYHPVHVERDVRREQAREIALEMHEQGHTYQDIAVAIGGWWNSLTIRQWCRAAKRDADALPSSLPNSTIFCFHGQKGSGKSLAAAHMAYEYYLQGVPVFYNPKGLLSFPPIPGGICQFASLRDIILRADQLRHCLVVLDEIQVNLSKYRTNTRASSLLRGVIQQVRKLGMDMAVTTNSPDQLDPAFPQQIDFDIKCKSHLPPMDKRDMIIMRWRDTQGAFGKGTAKSVHGQEVENRITWAEYIWPATDIYRLFDTTVQVDPLEVMGLTADEIQVMSDERDLGVDMDALDQWLRAVLIPELVESRGAQSVMASALASIITESYPSTPGSKLRVTPIIASKLARGLGLARRGRSGTGGFILPDIDDLENFKLGLWTAGDNA